MMKSSPVASVLKHVLLFAAVFVMLLPFFWVIVGSLKTQNEFLANPGAWFPENWLYFENYVRLFEQKSFGTYLQNSLIVSSVVVLTNLVFASMAGYALAKFKFRGQKVVLGAVVAAMTIPYVALFVPQFVIIVQAQLVNTLFAIMLPVMVLPISVFIIRQYGASVPDELLEAARMDGAGESRIFAQIFMPLIQPALATAALFSFLFSWNSFLWPLIVAQSEATYTLPIGLVVASQLGNTSDFGLLMAGSMVVMAPIVTLFLFLQRYFVQGLATVGLK